MQQSSSALRAIAGFAAAALALTGCASSQAWVREPEDSFATSASSEVTGVSAYSQSLRVSTAAEPALELPAQAPRHRLDHVVSLGEGAAASEAPSQPVNADRGATPTVVINIVNGAAPGSGAASYGYGFPVGYGYYSPRAATARGPHAGPSRVAPARTGTPTGTPPIGQDWQAPASYGPNFPYHTGPASPWERAR